MLQIYRYVQIYAGSFTILTISDQSIRGPKADPFRVPNADPSGARVLTLELLDLIKINYVLV